MQCAKLYRSEKWIEVSAPKRGTDIHPVLREAQYPETEKPVIHPVSESQYPRKRNSLSSIRFQGPPRPGDCAISIRLL